jgi:hypothetical protein
MPKRTRTFANCAVGGIATGLFLMCGALFLPQVACADTPSVSDFGQPVTAQAWATVQSHPQPAAFVTLYPDGRGSIQVRQIADDTLNAFATESSSWRMDHGLTWFVQMPVYVKEVAPLPGFGESSV